MPWWLVPIAAIVGAAGGVWLGCYFASKHLIEEVISMGFINFRGVRYRVDQIGRKAKAPTR